MKISILIPTRGRFNVLMRSMDSMFNNCFDLNNFELLLGMDNDDLSTMGDVKNYIFSRNYSNIKVIEFERIFYKNFHVYMNTLANNSSGDIIWLLADDVEINSPSWDKTLIDIFQKKEFLYGQVYNQQFEGSCMSAIPIISRKWLTLTGRIAENSQTDLWLGHIAVDLGIVTKLFDIKTTIFLEANTSQHSTAKFYSSDRLEWLKDKEKIRGYLESKRLDKKSIIGEIIDTSYYCKEGHVASSLSVLDILYVLYKEILHLDSDDRDRLILSKGHASLGLYAVLNHFKLLDCKLDSFGKFKSKLSGHPNDKINNVEASTGSLGHGLPIGVGLALGYKIKGYSRSVFVIIGDGEANEGTIWESALLASQHKLSNLVCIMDYNRSNDRALKLDNVIDKFKSFNWNCVEIDGHNHDQIKYAFENRPGQRPTFILANTIKGKGVELLENNPEWHHKSPNVEEFKIIKCFLEGIFDHAEQTINESKMLVRMVLESNKIKGDLVEVGTGSGGSAKIVNFCKSPEKELFLFDDFVGIVGLGDLSPYPDYNSGVKWLSKISFLSDLFYGSKVKLIKGHFPQSIPDGFSKNDFSFVHVDTGDYQSTSDCLYFFYDKVNPGGLFAIHGYNDSEINRAVNKFLVKKREKIVSIVDSQIIIQKRITGIELKSDRIQFKDFFNTIQGLVVQTEEEINNLCKYVQEVQNIEGDIVEVGVFRGGSALALNYFKSIQKRLYLFDTFEGLADCSSLDGNLTQGNFRSSYNDVKELFDPEDNMEIVVGYFPNSASKEFESKKFSFVHLDADTYESTFNSLNYFYAKMAVGAIFIIHDYINSNAPGVKVAVDQFLCGKKEKVIFLCDSQIMIKKL